VTVAELHEKYAALEALRVARRAAPTGPPPLDELRALARRFPGALRELERLSLAEISARKEQLAEVLAGVPEPLWAAAQRRYHDELRAALTGRPLAPRGRGGLTAWATARVAGALGLEHRACRALLFPWTARVDDEG